MRDSREVDAKAWDVIGRALDSALDAAPTDHAALDRGVRVVEALVHHGLIRGPRIATPYNDVFHAESPTERDPRVRVMAGPDADAVALTAACTEAATAVASRFGIIAPQIEVTVDALHAAEASLLVDGLVVGIATDTKAIEQMLTEQLPALLTREETAELLEQARRHSPMVVQELVPNMLGLGQLRQVLHKLLAEQAPITRMSTILNALADNAVYTKDPSALTEHVRRALGRGLYETLLDDGALNALVLSPDAERVIQNGVQLNESGQVLILDPSTSLALHDNIADALQAHRTVPPVIIVPPKIRRHLRTLVARNFTGITVLSFAEIAPGVEVNVLATIEAHRPGMAPPAQPHAAERSDAEPPDLGSADGWNW